MDVYNNLPRVMTSLFFDTNLIPQEPDILLTYIGDLEDYKGISLVASSQNNGNPCVDGSIAAADPLTGGPAGNQILAFWPVFLVCVFFKPSHSCSTLYSVKPETWRFCFT